MPVISVSVTIKNTFNNNSLSKFKIFDKSSIDYLAD